MWADHPRRAAVLHDALAAAAASRRVPVRAGDAATELPDLLGSVPADLAVCIFHTAFLAHLPEVDRERFEGLVTGLSAARPIYWVQAERRSDPAEPRLRLTVCENGRRIRQWPLGRYQPHGQWLHWLAEGKGHNTVTQPAP